MTFSGAAHLPGCGSEALFLRNPMKGQAPELLYVDVIGCQFIFESR